MTTRQALAAQQQALLDALFAAPGASGSPTAAPDPFKNGIAANARSMLAYRANAQAQAERTLLATYPVIAQLLGADSFSAMARDFWHHRPPVRGDLAQWGGDLAAFLQASTQLAGEPYLGDVARVEWALHQAAGATDCASDPASLVLLSTHEPDLVTLVLPPGTTVVGSIYPVASIVTAHIDASPSLQQAGGKLRAGEAESALVWRQGYRPRVAVCSPPEATLILALLSGASLLGALENAHALDFGQWLAAAVRSGLVLGAKVQRG